MKECIDIYSRLLIATITFVVPIIINLLSTFSAGEKRRKELAENSSNEITKRASEELQNNPADLKETISKTNKEYQEIDRVTKRELKLLNPLIQFWNIFSGLSLSLIFLLIFYLVKSSELIAYKNTILLWAIFISTLSYLTALGFIIRILYTISKARRIIDNN